jgi:hypothetical protein
MKTKVCSKCKEEKKICEFRKKKSSKDGLRSECKECSSLFWKKYRDVNSEKISNRKKNDYIKNREKILDRVKKYRDENIDIIREKDRVRSKERYKKTPEKLKDYYNKNKKSILKYKKTWAEQNHEKIKEQKREYMKKRNSTDSIFNLKNRMRTRIWNYIRTANITKKNKTFDIVGCTPQFLKEHLEKQFVNGMTWENRKEWHIDHIIPLSSAETEDELYRLCHYTNLQPLWSEENLKKGNKILEQHKQ